MDRVKNRPKWSQHLRRFGPGGPQNTSTALIIQGWERSVNMANKWYEQAKRKLEAEKGSGNYDRYASAMKDAVCEALDGFCRQDAEFAQAVVQGGTFAECMKAVAKGCGSAISDLEAFRRAVRFYFPGADVKFHMTVNLCADVEAEATEQAAGAGPKILNLDDFL